MSEKEFEYLDDEELQQKLNEYNDEAKLNESKQFSFKEAKQGMDYSIETDKLIHRIC